jgi:hypothetical protein
MSSILRRVVALVALAVGIGVAAGTAPAAAATTHTFRSGGTQITIAHPAQPAGGYKLADDWWF